MHLLSDWELQLWVLVRQRCADRAVDPVLAVLLQPRHPLVAFGPMLSCGLVLLAQKMPGSLDLSSNSRIRG